MYISWFTAVSVDQISSIIIVLHFQVKLSFIFTHTICDDNSFELLFIYSLSKEKNLKSYKIFVVIYSKSR